jgi:hypothetical protein
MAGVRGSFAQAILVRSRDRFALGGDMRRSRMEFWGGLAASIILSLGPTSVVQAQDTGETLTILPEVSVSAQADRAFFAPDTASQGVVTGKQIEEQRDPGSAKCSRWCRD